MTLRAANVFIICVVFTSPAIAMPSWAKTTTDALDGHHYRAVCSGIGPSIDLARNEAVLSCKASAVRQTHSDGSVKALTIESNSDVAFYQEVAEAQEYRNLTCNPKKEEIEETGDGSYQVWLLCQFDMREVEVTSNKQSDAKSRTSGKASKHLSMVKTRRFDDAGAEHKASGRHAVILVIIPRCDRVLVRGERPRPVKCDVNPLTLVVEDGDEEATITANGFISKTLDLRKGNLQREATIQIILEAQ